MLRTLRRQLILSHVLPLLVIVPLIGIALIYVLETQVLLPNLAEGLAGDARLIAHFVSDQPNLWHDPIAAQAVLARLEPDWMARAMLLDTGGRLLASTDPADAERIGQLVPNVELVQSPGGEIDVHTAYSHRLHAEIADVVLPVQGPDQQVVGFVRLSHRLTGVRAWFLRLRYLTAGVLAVGLLFGAAIGLSLATVFARSVKQVTQAIYGLVSDQRLDPLPERGPEEIRIMSRAVNVLAERRRSVEQATRRLLSNLVHEVGRPLGACFAAIGALQDGAVEDRAAHAELLDGIASEVQSLQRLLDDLSQLNARVAGKFDLQRRPVAVARWLSGWVGLWREAAYAKGLHWEADVPEDLPEMTVDPERLGQALGNLLSNAIKFTPTGGRVSLRAGVADGRLWIRVSDTGPGITPEDQVHIFTPFYRVQHSDKLQQGMGLGLTIAHDLVTAHSGRLEVESTPGQGARFTVWLKVEPVANNDHDRRTVLV